MAKAPGRSHRKGITLMELFELASNEASAQRWFESVRWPHGRFCPHCGSTNTSPVKNAKPMPYRCRDCRAHFSVRTDTALEKSKVPLHKWLMALYLYLTSLKGISSMKLHRELGVTQKTAWFMLHRIREAWGDKELRDLAGPIEADETFIGGKRKNKPKKVRALAKGAGAVDMEVVAGVKDRASGQVSARVVPNTGGKTLKGFVMGHAGPDAAIYTDESRSYRGLPNHEAVNHGAWEYVRGEAHTNGVESFWSMLKRGYHGTYHKMSPKHLDRYVSEFSGRHNVREKDTIAQMEGLAAAMIGKRLTYHELTED